MSNQTTVNADLKCKNELLESEVILLRDDQKEHLNRLYENKVTILKLEDQNKKLSNEIVELQTKHLDALKMQNDTLYQLEKENRLLTKKSGNLKLLIMSLSLLVVYLLLVSLFLSGRL